MNKDRVTFMFRYAIEIFFSQEDEGFIAVVPELRGCTAFGNTRIEALKEVLEAMGSWIDNARENGIDIPEPANLQYLTEDMINAKRSGEILS